jgi:hypothetical protein
MAAQILVPFNFCPVTNPSRKNSSFTVDAGKYALVEANSPFFTIGGTNMFPSYTHTFSNSAGGTTEDQFLYFTGGVYVHTASITSATNNSDTRTASFGFGLVNGGSVLSYKSQSSQTITSNTTAAIAAAYVPTSSGILVHRITTGASSTTSSTIQFYYFPDGKTKKFWISGGAAGVALNGNDYTVTLYNQVT